MQEIVSLTWKPDPNFLRVPNSFRFMFRNSYVAMALWDFAIKDESRKNSGPAAMLSCQSQSSFLYNFSSKTRKSAKVVAA